jgi:hypothetical protein
MAYYTTISFLLVPLILLALMVLCAIIQVELKTRFKGKTNQPRLKSGSNVKE